MVNVTLHGALGEECCKNWNLDVKSLSEAIRAIELNTKKLYKFLIDKDKENIRYAVVINGRNFHTENEPTLENPRTILESELCIKSDNLETIDIIPVLEGADSNSGGIITALLGVILIIVGIATIWAGGSGALAITAGITLLAGGIYSLLSRPPKFDDFREIEQGGKTSYLFSGPQNVIGEGGPVPLCYGNPIVGSQVISAAYVVRDYNVTNPRADKFVRSVYDALEAGARNGRGIGGGRFDKV